MQRTVLVVEDDPSVAKMLDDALSRAGFVVINAADGVEGFEAFEAHPVDLAIVDLLIPKLQGFDLIRQIRDRPKGADLPIIVMSGVLRGPTYKVDLVQRFGVHAYIEKPFDLDELQSLIRSAFDAASGAPPRSPTRVDRDPPPLPIPMKADLADVTFGQLLGGLFARKVTGALMLRRSSVKKLVYFADGVPLFVKSNLLSECLGRVMVSERLITQDECDRSLERKKHETGRRQGEILVEMGSISQHNLEFALELQMQNKLFDVFGWRDGRYQFNESADYRGPQVALSMGATTLVHEGASRHMEPERIAAALAPMMPRRVVISSEKSFRYQALQLDPRAERMIDRINGQRTLADLLTTADFRRADANLVAYALLSTALLRVVPEAARPPAPAPIAVQDVQSLSTGEIDAIASLQPIPTPPPTAPPPPVPPAEQRTVDEFRLSQIPLPVDNVDEELLAAVARASTELPRASTAPFEEPPAPEAELAPPPAPEAELAPPPPPAPELARSPELAPAPELSPSPASASELEVESEPSTELPHPAPAEDSEPPASPAPIASQLASPAGVSNEPRRKPISRMSSLPRSGKWTGPNERTGPPEPPTEETSEPPNLSDDVRRQVRARLEARIARVAEARQREKTRTPPRRGAKKRNKEVGLDLDAARQRMEGELSAKFERMSKKTFYEVLQVNPDATAQDVREAYKVVAKKLDPDRVVAGRGSHASRVLAEKTYLLATRALNTLTNDAARREYDRSIGIDPGPRMASLFVAEAAFERARVAMQTEDWHTAEAELLAAVSVAPDDAAYHAHLAYVRFSRTPDDGAVREACLDAMVAALEHYPDDVELLLFLGAIARKHGDKQNAVSAYRRAIELDPDCVVALDAMRELVPPTEKKGGILSRYFAG